jgi:hypothetical protein
MDETYRMLGREHEADLEREAQRRHLAANLGRRSSADRPMGRARKAILRRLVALPRVTGQVTSERTMN